jgi:hypothetical protein
MSDDKAAKRAERAAGREARLNERLEKLSPEDREKRVAKAAARAEATKDLTPEERKANREARKATKV